MHATEVLRDMVEAVPERLRALPGETAARRGPDAWSPREELGHLLDSAVVNHVRLVRVQSEDVPQLPGYDGPYWVRLHNYHNRPWSQLIDTWQLLNQHLLMAAEGTPAKAWQRSCAFEGGPPVTLDFLLTDYVRHALDHLRHIGIRVDDFAVDGPAARSA
ncbi:MAG TPA: DinB family protein [Terriglobales bacterium]|nr:DinB family protein [Terriglobales bacterium]